jgi:hypothetical protein
MRLQSPNFVYVRGSTDMKETMRVSKRKLATTGFPRMSLTNELILGKQNTIYGCRDIMSNNTPQMWSASASFQLIVTQFDAFVRPGTINGEMLKVCTHIDTVCEEYRFLKVHLASATHLTFADQNCQLPDHEINSHDRMSDN